MSYNKMREIIANGCLLKHGYIDDANRCCAIGDLALAAGIQPKTLRAAKGKSIILASPKVRKALRVLGIYCDPQMIKTIKEIAEAVRAAFNLTQNQVDLIQEHNDSYSTAEVRRQVILAYIDKLEVEQL
jgi:hypothetical protein